VDSGEMRHRLCLDCQVEGAVSNLRQEHARLTRKRERYRRSGANLEPIREQLAKVEARMARRIGEIVSDGRRAAQLLEDELRAAHDARYELKPR